MPPTVSVSGIAAALTRSVRGVYSGKAELVVFGALILIREDVVGLVDLLHLRLGFLVVGVKVGVVFFYHRAVGFFQLVVRSTLLHSEDLVIISFVCHIYTPLMYFAESGGDRAEAASALYFSC